MELQIAVQKMKEQRRILQALGIMYIAFYVIGFALAIFNLLFGLVMILCNGVFFLTVLRPKTKRYQHEFIKNTLRFGLGTGMTDSLYSGKKEVSEAALYQLPLLPGDRSAVLCKEGFVSRSKEFTMAGNEISLHYKVQQSGTGKSDYNFWSGTLLEFTWQTNAAPMPPCTFLDRRLAEPDALIKLKEKGVVEKKLSDPVAAERFILLQPEEAQPVWSAVLRRVKHLANTTQKGLVLCIQEQHLVVFVNNQFYTRKITVKHPVSEAVFQEPCLPEWNELLNLVRCCVNVKER